MESRCEINLENYCKTVNIEALTMIDMAKKEILPAVLSYSAELSDTLLKKKAALPELACAFESKTVARLSVLSDEIGKAIEGLEAAVVKYRSVSDVAKAADLIRDLILQKMAELRVVCDEAEGLTAKKYWPFPTYSDLLFGVR